MKKATIYTSLFLFVFGLTAGFTLTFTDDAMAIEKCDGPCLGENRCHTDETGPLCLSNPRTPYYLYFHPSCADGPFNCPGAPYWVGCCADLPEIPFP
jgi:hypothetical protein